MKGHSEKKFKVQNLKNHYEKNQVVAMAHCTKFQFSIFYLLCGCMLFGTNLTFVKKV